MRASIVLGLLLLTTALLVPAASAAQPSVAAASNCYGYNSGGDMAEYVCVTPKSNTCWVSYVHVTFLGTQTTCIVPAP